MAFSKVYVGIDPGKEGAVAVIWPGGWAESWHTPTAITKVPVPNKFTAKGKPKVKSSREYLLPGMLALLRTIQELKHKNYNGSDLVVALEAQQCRPEDAKPSVLTTGRGWGYWEMACVAIEMAIVSIQPSTWKPKYLAPKSNKAASLVVAQRLYPAAGLILAKDEARAEAILIADFLRRVEMQIPYPRRT